MQDQKKYHQRKLAIIEMIEECDRCIENAEAFINSFATNYFSIENSHNNIARYTRIKNYLTERYNR